MCSCPPNFVSSILWTLCFEDRHLKVMVPIHYMCKGRFTLWPNFERRSVWINENAEMPKVRPLDFTLEAEVQRMSPPKEPRWQHFLELMAPRVWPHEPSLGRAKCSTQTSVERPNLFLKNDYFNIYFQPKGFSSRHSLV